jgi:molybdopterin-containing oxidoreductase family membrane subunit
MLVRVSGRALVIDPRVVLRVLRDEAVATPRPLRAWYGLLGLLILIGAIGAVRALFPGDKGVATTPSVEWGLLIVAYVFLAITTSGLCLASSLGTVFGIDRFRPLEKRHAILAVLCLVTAFGVIALDLHYPIRLVFGAALNPSLTSPMWWMGVFYGIYLGFLLTEVWSIFWHHERIHSIACLLSSAMAVIAPTTLGAVFGVLAARPYWTGVFTPILTVASALLAGTALLGVVFFVVERLRLAGHERAGVLAIPAIRYVMLVALAIVGVLIARQLIVGLTTTDPGLSAATHALISGPLAVQFVGVRLIAGLVVPLGILLLPWTRGSRGVLMAGGLSLVGVFADRLSFVAAGQIAPTTAISGVVSTPYAVYTPSLVEISILIGAIGFVALLYTLAERYLDLRESEVHIGFSLPLRVGRLLSTRATASATPDNAPLDAAAPTLDAAASAIADVQLTDPPAGTAEAPTDDGGRKSPPPSNEPVAPVEATSAPDPVLEPDADAGFPEVRDGVEAASADAVPSDRDADGWPPGPEAAQAGETGIDADDEASVEPEVSSTAENAPPSEEGGA